MLKLYRHALSGHCHRIELFLSILGLEAELIDVDLANGQHKSPEFLKLNPYGLIPVLQDGDIVLYESNAILVYLAKKYGTETWLPNDPVLAAEVEKWLAIINRPLATGPARARLITVFNADYDASRVIEKSHAVLKMIDSELSNKPFLTGETATIADISAYAYIAHAPEGNVSLAQYDNINAWLERVQSLDSFIPMPTTKAGLVA